MKRVLLMLSLLLPVAASADPAPFGLAIGKATVQQVKAKHKTDFTGTNKYTGGEMYTLDVSQINFEGLTETTVVFSKEGVLMAVLNTLPKARIGAVMQGLNGKYKLVAKEMPFVGNQSAKFVDGNTEILIDAPHLSFDMTLNYIHGDLMKDFRETTKREAEAAKKKEAESL